MELQGEVPPDRRLAVNQAPQPAGDQEQLDSELIRSFRALVLDIDLHGQQS